MEKIIIKTQANLDNIWTVRQIFKQAGWLFVCSVTQGNETELEFRKEVK